MFSEALKSNGFGNTREAQKDAQCSTPRLPRSARRKTSAKRRTQQRKAHAKRTKQYAKTSAKRKKQHPTEHSAAQHCARRPPRNAQSKSKASTKRHDAVLRFRVQYTKLRCKKIAGSRNRTKDALQYVIANSCHAVHYSTVQYLVPAQLEAQHRSNCEVGSGALGVDKVSPAHHQWSVLCNTVPSTRPEHHQYSKSLYSAVPERHLFITSAPPVHHQHLTIHHQYIASRASNNTVVTSTSPVHNTVQHVPDAASQVHHQYNTAQYCTSTARHHCIISTVLYTTCASPVQYISSTPPVHHQHITSTSPVHRQRITSASPVHHQRSSQAHH